VQVAILGQCNCFLATESEKGTYTTQKESHNGIEESKSLTVLLEIGVSEGVFNGF
jgi:hypothetical protein